VKRASGVNWIIIGNKNTTLNAGKRRDKQTARRSGNAAPCFNFYFLLINLME
jgi:hypothetical protein